jgi:glucose-6-phosphate isomerase
MKISIHNVSHQAIKPEDRIEKEDIESMIASVASIQHKFLDESKDYSKLVADLRAWTKCHEQDDIIKDTIRVAKDIRDSFKPLAFVTIGIGGSDLGSRTLHACLNHTQHNLLSIEDRGGAPELYFTGDTFDPVELYDILEVLEKRGLLLKTIYNVISKSGQTSETVASFLVIKERLEKKLKEAGRDAAEYASFIVATTGLNDKSALYKLNDRQKVKFRALLPVPDGVGGRFSFASPVGLLFMGVTANYKKETVESRIAECIRGLSDAEKSIYMDPLSPENVASNIAIVNFLAEKKGKGTVCFYPYAKTLKLIGEWYTQLSTESLQEKGQGQNVIPTCGPTGNHSILNGIINGPRDKVILFIKVDEFDKFKDFTIPSGSGIGGELEVLEGKKFGYIQNASQLGTEVNFTHSGVINMTVTLPTIDAYTICKLMYILECAVAFEGELRHLGRLTYEQSGVEGYKQETRRVLSEK